jgi:hypothetical protein
VNYDAGCSAVWEFLVSLSGCLSAIQYVPAESRYTEKTQQKERLAKESTESSNSGLLKRMIGIKEHAADRE